MANKHDDEFGSESEWELFRSSFFRRHGWDVFYHPRFYTNRDPFEFPEPNYPWWAPVIRWSTRWADRACFIRHILDPEFGWLRYDDGYGVNRDITHYRWMHSHFLTRLFYVSKAIFCILFLQWRRMPDNARWKSNWINAASFNFSTSCGEYSGENWESVDVGYGVFKNWYVYDYTDSSY